MATLIDAVGVLEKFGVYDTILPFLLIAAGTYALLTKFKPFGEMKVVNAIVSTVLGLFVISMLRAVTFIKLLMPILTIFLMLIVLALLIFTFMGIKGESIAEMFQQESAAWGILLVLFIIIIFAVVSMVFPEASVVVQNPVMAEKLNITAIPENATAAEQAGAYLFGQTLAAIFSPVVIGLIILMLVFGVAIYFITREPEK